MMLAFLLLASSLSSGNAEFDDAARDGARTIALARVRDELVAKGPASGVLERAMLADPARHVTREESERLCRDAFADAVRAQYAEKVRAIDERLGLKAAEAPADDALAATVAGRHFDDVFDAERKAAVETQAKTIVATTRPPESDFDAKEDWELREQMLALVLRGQATPVFAENRQFVSERIVEPVLQDARREQRRQAAYLMDAPCDTAAPSRLSAALRARLEENVKERRAKAEDPSRTWGVFAGTFNRSVGPAVERRTLSRLEKKIEALKFEVEGEALARTIALDAAAHVKADESARIFRALYADELLARALEDACAEAPAPDRAELRDYLTARFADERLQKTVDIRLQRDVLPKWRRVRAEVAARQAKETWPMLADATWCPAVEVADEIAARSDYAKAVRDWRAQKGLESLAAAAHGKTLMEEAERTADAAVAAAFDLARSAIVAQNGIVDDCHASVLAESRRRKDSFWTRTPDLKTVVALLTREVERRWDDKRLETLWPDKSKRPTNAAAQHRALFPSVQRKIELLARVILEEMNEPKPEEKEPPEEPPPEDETTEDPIEEPEEALFAISVKRTGESVEVELTRGGSVVESATVPAKKNDFENAMFKVTEAISRILDLK